MPANTPAALRVYMKLTRSAVVTVTDDTEHDVRFASRAVERFGNALHT